MELTNENAISGRSPFSIHSSNEFNLKTLCRTINIPRSRWLTLTEFLITFLSRNGQFGQNTWLC